MIALYCEDCEEKISVKRVNTFLKFKEEVKTCIDCQLERERDGRAKRATMTVHANVRCGELENIENIICR